MSSKKLALSKLLILGSVVGLAVSGCSKSHEKTISHDCFFANGLNIVQDPNIDSSLRATPTDPTDISGPIDIDSPEDFQESVNQKLQAHADNYYGLTHPSDPNYYPILGGSDFGFNYNCPGNCFDFPDWYELWRNGND